MQFFANVTFSLFGDSADIMLFGFILIKDKNVCFKLLKVSAYVIYSGPGGLKKKFLVGKVYHILGRDLKEESGHMNIVSS